MDLICAKEAAPKYFILHPPPSHDDGIKSAQITKEMNAKYATNRVQQTDATTKNAKNIKRAKNATNRRDT